MSETPECRPDILTRWKPGQSGNPKGTSSAGSLIKHHLNAFGDMGLNEIQIREIAKDKSLPWTRRAAAARALRTMEAGDLADFDDFLDGKHLKDLRKEGINTEVVKKAKQKTREIPQEGGPPIIETEREIELFDRAGEDFDRIMDRTEGKPKQETALTVTHNAFVFVTPSGPIGQLHSLGAIDATATEMPENATFTQIGENSAVLEAAGGAPAMAPDAKVIETGEAFRSLIEGTLTDQFILFESRRGTGKTRGILTAFAKFSMQHPGSRWMVVRSTRTRLTDSAIATFVEQICPLFGWPVPTCQRSQVTTYKCPNGSEFVFQALDDPGRQQSVECAGVYVMEGTEIDSLETITALAGAMRQVCNPPIPVYYCVVDVNPGAPSHPLNKAAETVPDSLRTCDTREDYAKIQAHNRTPAQPGKWKRILCHHADNPAYFDARAWAWTDMGKKYLGTLSHLTGHLRKRWLLGLWTAAEGSVFGGVFDLDVHVVEDFEPPTDWALYVGWDPGIDHVTGMPWVFVAPNGDYYVYDEVYEGGKSIASHVQDNVLPRLHGHTVRRWMGDPHHFFSSTAQSPESCAQQAVKAGLSYAVPWADLRGPAKQHAVNALIEMLQNTARVVRGDKRVGPCLFVMKKCTNTTAEFQSWSYRRNAKGEQLTGDDAYEDRLNHLVGDPLVGMLASRMMTYEETAGTVVGENG